MDICNYRYMNQITVTGNIEIDVTNFLIKNNRNKTFKTRRGCGKNQEGASIEEFEQVVKSLCESTPGSRYISYQDTNEQLEESSQQIKLLAWGLIFFIALIGLLNIINTTYTNIHTRVNEIGMQRAIGMSTTELYKVFLWEGAYYGLIAALIGSITGYICTIFVQAAITEKLALVAFPLLPILQVTLVSISACLLSTCIPLIRIARMSIVESIETVE